MRTKVDLSKYIEENNFAFDNAFDENASNEQVYDTVVQPLVYAAFMKAKVTCFAYGQTGSGKTFTMMGDMGKGKVQGLYLMAAQDLFNTRDTKHRDLSVWVSFYEIYCGKAYDLLNKRNGCFIRVDAKDNVHIVGLSERQIVGVDGLMDLIRLGSGARMTGQTGMNDESSRSHAILQIILRNHNNKMHGKMSFIDLAGSERGADVKDSQKQTRIDGAEINKSLLALKECKLMLKQASELWTWTRSTLPSEEVNSLWS